MCGMRGEHKRCPPLGEEMQLGSGGARSPLTRADELLTMSVKLAKLDGKCAVFGCAAEGMHIGKKIEAMMIFLFTTTFCVMTKQ